MNRYTVLIRVGVVAAIFTFASAAFAQERGEKKDEVRAARVKLIVYGNDNEIQGAITGLGEKKWLEVNESGRHELLITGRDEWSLYFTNEAAGYEIQVDLYTKRILHGPPGEAKGEVYQVLKAIK